MKIGGNVRSTQQPLCQPASLSNRQRVCTGSVFHTECHHHPISTMSSLHTQERHGESRWGMSSINIAEVGAVSKPLLLLLSFPNGSKNLFSTVLFLSVYRFPCWVHICIYLLWKQGEKERSLRSLNLGLICQTFLISLPSLSPWCCLQRWHICH